MSVRAAVRRMQDRTWNGDSGMATVIYDTSSVMAGSMHVHARITFAGLDCAKVPRTTPTNTAERDSGRRARLALYVASFAAADDDALLDRFQRAAFDYFLRNRNPANGLYADTSREGSPVSIAVVGFALSSYPVAVERGWIARDEPSAQPGRVALLPRQRPERQRRSRPATRASISISSTATPAPGSGAANCR